MQRQLWAQGVERGEGEEEAGVEAASALPPNPASLAVCSVPPRVRWLRPQTPIPSFPHPLYPTMSAATVSVPSEHTSSLSSSCRLCHYSPAKPRLPLAGAIVRVPSSSPVSA